MKRWMTVISYAVVVLFCSADGICFETDLAGRLQSTYVLRDTNGFQYGFLDETQGVQWRTELKLDLTLKPEYESVPDFRLEKVFLSYKGAYDAIFELTDRYDDVREKSPRDFELGKDDIEWENDLREAFIDLVGEHGAQGINLRLGRQIVMWGEADGFNVINIVCPDDNSYQMFFSDVDDLATPLWMARLDYSYVDIGPFSSLGVQLLAIPDIRPDQFAPLGGTDGWANFDAPYAFIFEDFEGMGIQEVREDVAARTLENMEYGIKLSGTIGNFNGALHYFVGYQDEPAVDFLDWGTYYAPIYDGLPPGTYGGEPNLYFRHPRQRTYAYSFNHFFEPFNCVFRGEGSLTDKTALMDMIDPSGTAIGMRKVYQNLVAVDKNLYPKWLGTDSALQWNLQLYWKHIDDWKDNVRDPFTGERARDVLKDTYRITCYLFTDYYHGQIAPEVILLYEPEGIWFTMASILYTPTTNWFFKITQMSSWGNKSATSEFSGLIGTSELSFRIGYKF